MIFCDLFSGAGGAAMGLYRGMIERDPDILIIGIDNRPQPHYPAFHSDPNIAKHFRFVQGDALRPPFDLSRFDFVWASPPCQKYSQAVKKINREKREDLIIPTRKMLCRNRVKYIIENVPPAKLISPIILCGSSFNLPIRRHRKFESNCRIVNAECNHNAFPPVYPPAWNRKNPLRVLSISGGYQTRKALGVDYLEIHKKGMGIDWDISYSELSESIPPAYSEYLIKQIFPKGKP